MRAEVFDWCRRQGLFDPGDRVICAVSGGADSMAMLWCLHSLQQELDITVSAAHFNHHLRGAESDRDEAFVRTFCAEHQIGLQIGGAEVQARGRTLEEAAREARYAFLKALTCDKLATAHNADDNAETILLHLLRGSGLRGLCGIPPKRDHIVRPLLSVSREQIAAYLTGEGLSWVEDSTNAADDCTRNRLRHHILPLLRREAPGLAEQLLRQSDILRQEDELLDAQAEQLLQTALLKKGFYSCGVLAGAPRALQRRALRVLIRRYLPQDVTHEHIQSLQELLTNSAPSAQLSLPRGVVARRCYNALTLEPPLPSFSPVTLQLPGETTIPELGIRIHCVYQEKFQKNSNPLFHFALKYDMIPMSFIQARPRSSGDMLITRDGHHVALKKLFIDRKIPREERSRRLVLACGDTVAAVEGFGESADFAAVEGAPAWIITLEKEEI